jgi:hypothetical protein
LEPYQLNQATLLRTDIRSAEEHITRVEKDIDKKENELIEIEFPEEQ